MRVKQGGTVAPGNSIGTLTVLRDVQFDPGSLYRVEIDRRGQSDSIQSAGAATLNGGEVAVSLVNSENLLSRGEVLSLAGQKFSILSAAKGVSGQFSTVAPDYLFIGTQLAYQPEGVALAVGRNNTAFARVAQTANERAVAQAADQLPAGNPVYESILASATASEARAAFGQLAGQIHADVASALLNNSRQLRDSLNARLRQAQHLAGSGEVKTADNGAWGQILGSRDTARGSDGITGYHASTWGVLLGGDTTGENGLSLGGAAGVTRTTLSGGNRATAHSDNYHLALYGGQRSGPFALRTGLANTWHRIETERQVRYGMQADKPSAGYNGTTLQWFAEAGYSVDTGVVDLEPFARLSWARTQQNGFREKGGAAALSSRKQHIHSSASTLGWRAGAGWELTRGAAVALRGELGWQHQYNDTRRGSTQMFDGATSAFRLRTVSAPQDSLVMKLTADITLNQQTALTFSYSGLSGKNQQDNSIQAGFRVQF